MRRAGRQVSRGAIAARGQGPVARRDKMRLERKWAGVGRAKSLRNESRAPPDPILHSGNSSDEQGRADLETFGEFPDVVTRAAESREPHHLAYWVRELAGLWNPYLQDGVRHRVLSDDPALTNARLGLALAVRTVLANALGCLGISAPEQM